MLNFIKKVFSLETFVSPKILKHVYIFSILVAIAYGSLLITVYIDAGLGLAGIIAGIIGLILTPIFVRIIFELMVIPFRILEELQEMNNKKRK